MNFDGGAAQKMIILGIDPGSQNLGYGVIRFENFSIHYLEHGVLSVRPQAAYNDRLQELGRRFAEVIARYNPAWVSVEKVFVGKNVDSAFKLGHIRGVCIYESIKQGARIAEYATREIKKGVTGNGSAQKEQVALLLEAELGLTRGAISDNSLDASDALAAAFFHAQRLMITSRLASTET